MIFKQKKINTIHQNLTALSEEVTILATQIPANYQESFFNSIDQLNQLNKLLQNQANMNPELEARVKIQLADIDTSIATVKQALFNHMAPWVINVEVIKKGKKLLNTLEEELEKLKTLIKD